MNEIIRKLTSRKFWMSIAGVATGVAMFLGSDGSEIGAVAGSVTTIISAVVYIITEGKIDAARISAAAEAAEALTKEPRVSYNQVI